VLKINIIRFNQFKRTSRKSQPRFRLRIKTCLKR